MHELHPSLSSSPPLFLRPVCPPEAHHIDRQDHRATHMHVFCKNRWTDGSSTSRLAASAHPQDRTTLTRLQSSRPECSLSVSYAASILVVPARVPAAPEGQALRTKCLSGQPCTTKTHSAVWTVTAKLPNFFVRKDDPLPKQRIPKLGNPSKPGGADQVLAILHGSGIMAQD